MQDERELYAYNDNEFEPEGDEYSEDAEDGFGDEEEEEEEEVSISVSSDEDEDLGEVPEGETPPTAVVTTEHPATAAKSSKRAGGKASAATLPTKKTGPRDCCQEVPANESGESSGHQDREKVCR
jgi:hypothetical protein